jgi:hypothetical protein
MWRRPPSAVRFSPQSRGATEKNRKMKGTASAVPFFSCGKTKPLSFRARFYRAGNLLPAYTVPD